MYCRLLVEVNLKMKMHSWVQYKTQAFVNKLCAPIIYYLFQFQKCPFGALSIVNLPSNLEKETTHRYCANAFKLHRYFIFQVSKRQKIQGFDSVNIVHIKVFLVLTSVASF